VSLLWAGRPAPGEQRVLDGRPVPGITSRLDPAPRIPGSPRRLAANAGQSFQGSNILGTGFTLPPAAAQALISKDPRNADVLFPYLNGADLNSRWDCSARRWVINFRDWPASRAAQYPDCLAIVEQAVRPARARNPDRRRREIWWQFTRPALDLYQAIAGFDRVLVFAQTSRTQMPALVPARQVLSHMLVVIAADEPARLALHSSELQYSWTARYSAGLKADLRFIPSDCFETFPRPAALPSRARRAGEALDRHRQDLMERRRIGLTAVYNLLHDQAVADPDIAALRDIHEEADNAVRDAYADDEDADPAIGAHESALAQAPLPSWRDLDLRRQFRQTSQGARFTITPQARADLMDKLLALNLYRHAREIQIT
jgi:hypothetical protein